MKTLKVSFFAVHNIIDIQNSVFFHLLKNKSKREIEIVSKEKADILIIGPYDSINYKRIVLNKLLETKYCYGLINLFGIYLVTKDTYQEGSKRYNLYPNGIYAKITCENILNIPYTYPIHYMHSSLRRKKKKEKKNIF